MILNKNKLLSLLLLCSFFLIGCAGVSSISTRPGYERFPAKTKEAKNPAKAGMIIKGMASYYGPGFNGKLTASGEHFNQNAMTCAHKTLPFNTRLRVTRKDNGKSVVVRVNDRGPYAHGRILDLSVSAAKKLDLVSVGHAYVIAEVIK